MTPYSRHWGEVRVANQEPLSLIGGDIAVLVAGAVHGDNTIGDIAVLDGGAFIRRVDLIVIWSFRGSEALNRGTSNGL